MFYWESVQKYWISRIDSPNSILKYRYFDYKKIGTSSRPLINMENKSKINFANTSGLLRYFIENRRLKKKIKTMEQESGKSSLSYCAVLKRSVCFLVVLFALIVYYKYDEISLEHEIARMSEIQKELQTTVYHQHKAVKTVLRNLVALHEKQWRGDMLVLPFVGTSGVSKTYISNIIKQNYYPEYVLDLSKLQLLNKDFGSTYFDTLKQLGRCCNLIVIDGLSPDDIDVTLTFIKALPNHKIALVIPIINTQEVNVIGNQLEFKENDKVKNIIAEKFKQAAFNYEVVFFDAQTKSTLETGIIQLMIENNIDYAKCGHLIEEVLKDHDIASQGYKLLHNKLNIIWECGKYHSLVKN